MESCRVCVKCPWGGGGLCAAQTQFTPRRGVAISLGELPASCPLSQLLLVSGAHSPWEPGPELLLLLLSPAQLAVCCILLLLLSRGMTNLDEGASVRPRREAMPPHAAGDPALPPPPLAVRGTPAVCVPTLD